MIKPFKLPKEQREELVRGVQTYFENELDQTIGNLGAEQFLDFMIRELSPYLYNQALADARHVLAQKMASLEEELYSLEVPVRRGR
ncbi:DUF2164 domain-containing protein [Cohnella thailandensis]|uniref:DUF2164 domain-containing protein n=1 Tax=Cohnella thailandensis TaxID=557557 RepID=UPI001C869C46|nr:DUF2164 domain-containing protein [Cohnella thailandensis]MBP1976895.1 uncharacterized protein (DUF2164 family) [Cohnella thailandensis]